MRGLTGIGRMESRRVNGHARNQSGGVDTVFELLHLSNYSFLDTEHPGHTSPGQRITSSLTLSLAKVFLWITMGILQAYLEL